MVFPDDIFGRHIRPQGVRGFGLQESVRVKSLRFQVL